MNTPFHEPRLKPKSYAMAVLWILPVEAASGAANGCAVA